ncbi:hypothetical protein [Streptomyces sp. NPDC007355]|uniref:hypothetical protein n=1 Tax=Streptomyces sp. NPDC007355 TaxID=3364778 RepID=UPI0036781D5F
MGRLRQPRRHRRQQPRRAGEGDEIQRLVDAEILRQLLEEGWEIVPEDLAHIPYLTEHIKRLGKYRTHELGIEPEAYDPKLDVDFAPLREQDLTSTGFTEAA